MAEEAMSPLRRRMIEDMTARNIGDRISIAEIGPVAELLLTDGANSAIDILSPISAWPAP